MTRLSSDQDFAANLAGYSTAIMNLHRVFPEMEGNTRTANSDLQIKFQGELHRAMGWRRDHEDRF